MLLGLPNVEYHLIRVKLPAHDFPLINVRYVNLLGLFVRPLSQLKDTCRGPARGAAIHVQGRLGRLKYMPGYKFRALGFVIPFTLDPVMIEPREYYLREQ